MNDHLSRPTRILTVKQPWAWAIIHGRKDVENRVRNLAGDFRGRVAIHAGLVFDEPDGNDWELRRAITSEDNGWPASDGEMWGADSADPNDPRFAVRGAIIGVVDLTDAHEGHTCFSAHGRRCSPWAEARVWHLHLDNARALTTPIPFKGALGLRWLDEATIDLIDADLISRAERLECDRGSCYLGANHDGECEPGPSLYPPAPIPEGLCGIGGCVYLRNHSADHSWATTPEHRSTDRSAS